MTKSIRMEGGGEMVYQVLHISKDLWGDHPGSREEFFWVKENLWISEASKIKGYWGFFLVFSDFAHNCYENGTSRSCV